MAADGRSYEVGFHIFVNLSDLVLYVGGGYKFDTIPKLAIVEVEFDGVTALGHELLNISPDGLIYAPIVVANRMRVIRRLV